MKTLILALAALTMASFTSCSTGSSCPVNTAKASPKFSIGSLVASTVNQPEVGIIKGDIGKIDQIQFVGTWVVYWVVAEKDGKRRPFLQLDDSIEIEAVVYPDGALKP